MMNTLDMAVVSSGNWDMSEIEGVVKALPELTTTSTSASASASATGSETASTTTQYSVTVTPPSAAGNPNVWHNHKPDGTVFIVVGSIVGATILGMILWSVITSHLSRRNAKKSFREDQYRRHNRGGSALYDSGDDKELTPGLYGSEYGETGEKSRRSRLSLLGNGSRLRESNSSESVPGYEPEWLEPVGQETFNPIQDPFTRYNRNSLFISPTIEVAQKPNLLPSQRSRLLEKPYHQSSLSATSLLSSDEINSTLNKPERAASPERKGKKGVSGHHKRNKSSIGLTPANSSSSSSNDNTNDRRPRGGHHKQTPSMYLEDMLNVSNAA
ncbi:hypothetical protein HG536_0B03090 [Torulaspora globosa]|uniref:Vacuolar membrane protein n=1 Tax=Torulaspora globosa TaxID=48254 RepID=A0A7G3ZD60_9SACH|nr:uncharacterized protein HG536_0B03090 [Torulaspora globosa]QLL31446.1 hypothetical protein HG536_0B03090 [Torulaspora globosa]